MRGEDFLQNRQTSVTTERHGGENGGWTVACNTLDQNSIVYSIGVGNDISFELSLIHHYGLTVHAFDPTPRSLEWISKQKLPDRFCFHQVGVSDFDGTATFFPPSNSSFVSYSMIDGFSDTRAGSAIAPVRRIKTLMAELEHHRIFSFR